MERNLSSGRVSLCTSLGQARSLAALWIAAQATPATRAAVARIARETRYGLNIYESEGRRFAYYQGPFLPLYPLQPPPMWDRVQLADAEFYYAAKLLNKPTDTVVAVFTQRWDDLVDPTSPTTDLLDDLGLTQHPTIAAQIDDLPEDVKLQSTRRQMESGSTVFGGTVPCM